MLWHAANADCGARRDALKGAISSPAKVTPISPTNKHEKRKIDKRGNSREILSTLSDVMKSEGCNVSSFCQLSTCTMACIGIIHKPLLLFEKAELPVYLLHTDRPNTSCYMHEPLRTVIQVDLCDEHLLFSRIFDVDADGLEGEQGSQQARNYN